MRFFVFDPGCSAGGLKGVRVAPGINILWVERPAGIEQKSEVASRLGNFHIVDYNLFWMDIRENIKQRIDSYMHRK